MQLKALIVDDSPRELDTLKSLLNQNHKKDIHEIEVATTLDKAISLIDTSHYNLCFLEVELNKSNGFQLLPRFSPATKVVLTAANAKHAIQAIKEQVFDFLLKPINPVELKSCISRYIKELLSAGIKNHYLHIKAQGETIPLLFDDIEYIQANGAYSIIHLGNEKKYTTSKTLKALEKLLSDDFIRIHKTYIANKQAIKSYKKNVLTTNHNNQLPISRIGHKNMLKAL